MRACSLPSRAGWPSYPRRRATRCTMRWPPRARLMRAPSHLCAARVARRDRPDPEHFRSQPRWHGVGAARRRHGAAHPRRAARCRHGQRRASGQGQGQRKGHRRSWQRGEGQGQTPRSRKGCWARARGEQVVVCLQNQMKCCGSHIPYGFSFVVFYGPIHTVDNGMTSGFSGERSIVTERGTKRNVESRL